MSTSEEGAARRRKSLSEPEIVRAAIEILDAEGADALTFRSLAARLSTGSGAMYRHVSNKDGLLESAAAELVGSAIAGMPPAAADSAIRAVMLELFDLIHTHPWLGAQLARAPWQGAVLLVFEEVGERLTAMGTPAGIRFDVASALVHHLLGAAGQYAASARIPAGVGRAAFLKAVAANWSSRAGREQLPFVHEIAGELADHDDRRQFAAGVELILAGAAGRRCPATARSRSG